MNKLNELGIIKVSLKDFLTKPFLKMIIYPVIGSAIILYLLFFMVASSGLDQLSNTQIQIQQHSQMIENGEVITNDTSYTGNSIFDFLLQYSVVSSLIGVLVYIVGFFAIGYLSIFTSLLIIGLLTPKILSMIHQKHYKDLKFEGFGTLINSVWFLAKTIFISILLFLILIPIYFIPVINIIAINLPLYYLFHKLVHFDIGSTIFKKEDFLKIYYINKDEMRLRSLGLYLISLIPFIALFASVFYIIYLGHIYFSKQDTINLN